MVNSISALEQLGNSIDEVFFVVGIAILAIELCKGLFSSQKLGWRGVGDMFSSLSTQVPFLLIETFIVSFAYGFYTLVSDYYISWSFEITVISAFAAILVADIFYYWEHRLAHKWRMLWIHHAVHHSSRYMNIITGLRFGPFEGVWSAIIMFPMLLIGFPAELVIFGSLAVLAYQTWIHTELIGKLGWLEWILNTPSHHRVHHGSDDIYLDKNFGGILIIWDRLFGTFQKEVVQPRYGLDRNFDSINPLKVWFSEFPSFFKALCRAKNGQELLRVLF